MSNIRAVRKRQQLNNLVAMVTELAKPGYTVVDFCSGTVRVYSSISPAMHVYLSLHLMTTLDCRSISSQLLIFPHVFLASLK